MKHLPKLLIFFFSFSFFLLINKNVYASSSGSTLYEIFDPSLQQMIENEKTMRNAETDGNVRVDVTRQNRGELGAVMYNIMSMLAPVDPTVTKAENTALYALTKTMGTIYDHPPASGIAYVRNVLANAGLLAKPVYAQGIGFAGLAPLLPIWQTTRNIAYLVIVIVMVTIGFMIIFRMKIDPKTVISVQMALPKIVVALILITFSYAIVGFLIDLMYLVMAIAISTFLHGIGKSPDQIAATQTDLMTGSVWQLFAYIMDGGLLRTFDNIMIGWTGATTGGVGAISGIAALILKIANPLGAASIFLGIPLILGLIIFLGLLFTFIRLLLLLFNSYLQLIISLILGPIQLLTEAIPGKSAFSGWILNIIANLSVFPTTVMIILFATYLITLDKANNMWMPPLVGSPVLIPQLALPLGYDTNFFNGFLGLMILFIAPNLVASVKKLFKPKPALPVSAGTIMAPITGSTQTVMGAASQFYYMAQLRQMAGGLFSGGGKPAHPQA